MQILAKQRAELLTSVLNNQNVLFQMTVILHNVPPQRKVATSPPKKMRKMEPQMSTTQAPLRTAAAYPFPPHPPVDKRHQGQVAQSISCCRRRQWQPVSTKVPTGQQQEVLPSVQVGQQDAEPWQTAQRGRRSRSSRKASRSGTAEGTSSRTWHPREDQSSSGASVVSGATPGCQGQTAQEGRPSVGHAHEQSRRRNAFNATAYEARSQCATGVPGVTPGCQGHTTSVANQIADHGMEAQSMQEPHSSNTSEKGLQQEVHFLIAEGCTAEHHARVKRTLEIFKTATWAVAAAPPGTERRHFSHAIMQAKLVWAETCPQALTELTPDQVNRIFQNDGTFLRFVKSDLISELDQNTDAASASAPGQKQQQTLSDGKKDLWPQLRNKTMKKLRQRLVELRPYDIEQLFTLVNGLPLEQISALARSEGDLRQAVQTLFPQYAIWPYTPSTQNSRPEEDVTTQDAIKMIEMAQQLEGDLAIRQANAQHTEAIPNINCPIPVQPQQEGAVVVIDEPIEISQQNPGTPTPRPPTPQSLSPLIGSVPTTIVYTPETLDLLAPGMDLDAAADEALANLEDAERPMPVTGAEGHQEGEQQPLFRVPWQDQHPT